jgi:hypothetical protein
MRGLRLRFGVLMPRNNEDFNDAQALANDPTAKKLAAKGVVKNTHGQERPDYDEWMQEPDSDRY